MIGLISSVPEEGKLIMGCLKKRTEIAGKPLYRGAIGDTGVVYIISGMGKTNASHAATILLERFSPDSVILFGVGGAYPSSGLKLGDVAVAEKEFYGDEGVLTHDGFQGTEIIGIPLLKKGSKKYFNEFRLNKKLVKRAMDVIEQMTLAHPPKGGVKVKSGAFVTLSTCTGTRTRALELKKRFGAICENMEGAAVAHICASYGTPMIEIRGISNIVEDRVRDRWNMPRAAENCQRAVLEVFNFF
jgi:futalosine hydrolase